MRLHLCRDVADEETTSDITLFGCEQVINELSKIAEDMAGLLPLFVDGGSMSGHVLPTQHSARFKAMAIEAKAMIDEGLGRGNEYSMNLISSVNSGSGGFFGGPSYAAVEEASQIVISASRAISRRANRNSLPDSGIRSTYVHLSRIEALKTLPQDQWDFARLVELCRELNAAAANDCHMSTGFILRSILNHVPPIFGMENFARVASEFPFAKSVKSAMGRLQAQGRDGADFHLHQPIRRHEVLPTAAQVGFSQELDVLLGEVIRVVRGVQR